MEKLLEYQDVEVSFHTEYLDYINEDDYLGSYTELDRSDVKLSLCGTKSKRYIRMDLV